MLVLKRFSFSLVRQRPGAKPVSTAGGVGRNLTGKEVNTSLTPSYNRLIYKTTAERPD